MIACMKTMADHLERWWSYVDQSNTEPDACWPWTGGKSSKKYGAFNMPRPDGKGSYRAVGAHAWGFKNLVRPLEPGEMVLHTCDNPPCCRPSHWFAGTAADNNADRDRKGRQVIPRGESNGHARLTETQVREIRVRYITMEDLATQYGVGLTTIHNVIHRKSWAHVV